MRRHLQNLIRQRSLYGLLIPYGLGTLILIILPAFLTFGLSFTSYDALSPPVWRGLANFRAIFQDELFQVAVRNSLYFILLAVPMRVIGALLLALLFQRRRRGISLFRASIYLPTVIPEVAYALLWLWMFNPVYGPINALLSSLGLPAPAWLAEAGSARLAIVIMIAFQLGEGFVMLLAGLQSIPVELHDAAAVDGATRWQHFRFITMPMLAPWLVLLTVRDLIMSLQGTFTPSLIMTKGEPYYATLFLPLLIYQQAFDRFRFGIGAAMVVVMFVALALLLWCVSLVLRGWSYIDEH